MKAFAVLAHALLALAEAIREWARDRRRAKRRQRANETLADPDPDLERRGWLRDDAEAGDVPSAGEDRDKQE